MTQAETQAHYDETHHVRFEVNWKGSEPEYRCVECREINLAAAGAFDGGFV